MSGNVQQTPNIFSIVCMPVTAAAWKKTDDFECKVKNMDSNKKNKES